MNKKRIIIITIVLILVVILSLWISGIIPKQIAKISATNYLKKNFPKMQLEYVDIEWSSSFGGYSIRFKDENNEIYGFIMNNKYFPISLGQGLFGFEEEYREKYESKDIDKEEMPNQNNKDVVYPDFITKNKYTLDSIKQFCDENNIILEIEYITNSTYNSGTLIEQSKEMGTKVIEGSILKITVVK